MANVLNQTMRIYRAPPTERRCAFVLYVMPETVIRGDLECSKMPKLRKILIFFCVGCKKVGLYICVLNAKID